MSDPKLLYRDLRLAREAYQEALMGGSPAEIDDAERDLHKASLAYLEHVEPAHA